MAISREEIEAIAQSAADKVMVSKRCKEIGEKLLNSREILQTALDLAAHAKRPEDIVSSGLAKDMINQSKELSRDVELTGDDAMRLEVSLASALDSINKTDYDTAISHILKARRSLLDLMFQEVVTCECGEAKAIEEKLGKEALRKILATKESNPSTRVHFDRAGIDSARGNPVPTGTCYEDAWRFLIKQEEGELIHGSVQTIGKRINHAWVELPTGYVWEPESGEFMKKSSFYERAEPIEEHRYSPEEAAIMVARVGKHGPWTEEERARWLHKEVNKGISGIKLRELIDEVPDVDDPMAINYWRQVNDYWVYLEGWSDSCLVSTGFPPMERGEWDAKIDYMKDMTPIILAEKAKEYNRKLIKGGFVENEKEFIQYLYGVTYGIYEKAQ